MAVATHLVVTRGAAATLDYETGMKVTAVEALADVAEDDADLGAAIASGLFRADGMVVAPCSIKTLSAIANCAADTLLVLAADAGAVIMPAVTAMYVKPASVADVIDHTVMRICDQLGVDTEPVLAGPDSARAKVRFMIGSSTQVFETGLRDHRRVHRLAQRQKVQHHIDELAAVVDPTAAIRACLPAATPGWRSKPTASWSSVNARRVRPSWRSSARRRRTLRHARARPHRPPPRRSTSNRRRRSGPGSRRHRGMAARRHRWPLDELVLRS